MGIIRLLTLTAVFILTPMLLLTTSPITVAQQPNDSGAYALHKAIQTACRFLALLYNSTFDLVRETPISNSYHISSDNLLSQEALSYCNQTYAQSVRASDKPYENGTDMMHEALLNVPIPLPIHNATVYKLFDGKTGPYWQNIHDNYTIDWEVHNSTGILPDTDYADTASYTALEWNREGNASGVARELGILIKDFDGKGMNDTAFSSPNSSEHGIYQTYKMALYLSVLNTLNQTRPLNLVSLILQAQGVDGGFHTGYASLGGFAGTLENAETTAIVVLALESFTPNLRISTSPWNSGYLGVPFFLDLTLTNNGTKWLKVTNITVTLDYGTFGQTQGYAVEFFVGGGYGFSLPIPNTINPGNHSLAITIPFQFYDNVSGTWRTATPSQITSVLIVKPFPSMSLLPLQAAVVTAGFGFFSAGVSFRRGFRLSKVFYGKPLGRRLRLLLLLTGLTLYLRLSYFDYYYGPLFLVAVTLSVFATVVFGMSYFVKVRINRAILLPTLLLGLTATLASSVSTTLYRPPSTCYSGVRGAGLPLAWEIQTLPYLGPPRLPAGCPALFFQWLGPSPIYFLFDIVFYVTMGVGMIESYRIIRERLIKRTISSKT